MSPFELLELARDKRSVTLADGVDGRKGACLGIWPGRHQPAARVVNMQFQIVTKLLPYLAPYVRKADRPNLEEKHNA